MVANLKTAALTRGSKKQPVKRKRSGARGTRRQNVANKAAPTQPLAKKSTKMASMTVLLCRIKGVSLGELCKHTGWQPHSVRAVISSVIKKKLGLDVVSERVNGTRIYRVVV